MEPISRGAAYDVQQNSVDSLEVAKITRIQSSPCADSLTSAMLSYHSIQALNVIHTEGNETDKALAWLAKQAIGSGKLRISPNQLANRVVQFGMERNQGVLVIKAVLNEQSEYDILGVGFKGRIAAPVTVTLARPTSATIHAIRPTSALLSLPNELLMQITKRSGNYDGDINLAIRCANKRMNAIADDQMSPQQRFIITNGQKLSELSYDSFDMRQLATQTENIQNFILAHGKILLAFNHSPLQMWDLARQPDGRRKFVLAHGKTLLALGFNALEMLDLAIRPEGEQNFILTHGQTLLKFSQDTSEIIRWAEQPEDQRNAFLQHIAHCDSK